MRLVADFSELEAWIDRAIARCDADAIPAEIGDSMGTAIQQWIKEVLFSGTVSPRKQVEHYDKTGRGLYGAHRSEQPDWKINPWENMGGDAVKVARGIPLHPPFLKTMKAHRDSLGGDIHVAVTTDAKMKPYPGGPTMPTPHYLRSGWSYKGHAMRKRWHDGVVGEMLRESLRGPGSPLMRAVHRMKVYIFTGK